ncbi:hypothetical protein CDL12_24402 [Handroanthus impetiginosus]|uniref:FAS1 domain-containing protein n=1 Tax=Handroanthus impetiginosus TaxID=429701 RepID=A0A2G9GD08_9LAMI|nr:hypothetical protein CDL12_24402 [Handroanthus impetiginosus]
MSHPISPSVAPLFIVSAVLLLSTTTTSAFNITRLLGQYPDFSEFNSLLSKTHLAAEINSRKTITVLALTNGRLGDISGKPEDVQKRILSNHVVLDYYDLLKLNKLKDTKTVLTTLFQATGIANEQQGFLNVVHSKDGSILFGSAMRGAPIDAKLEGSVASQPYNISVLSVSHPIIAPGIDGTLTPVSAPPPKATAPAADKVPPPAASPVEEEPADAPTADSDADAPVPAPAPAVADAPADAPSPDAPADADDNQSSPPTNAAGKQIVSGVSLGLMVALVSSFLAAH